MKKLPVLLISAVLVGGCSQQRLDHACGSTDEPPIALDPSRCAAIHPDSDDVVNGARWYSAPANDVSDADERPVIGQPLDGDWWDPSDRHESVFEKKKRATKTAAPTRGRRS